MRKTIVGFMLVDTPHSALNNKGSEEGAYTDNTIAVKYIRSGRDVYPYVSAQALRYWWREVLREERGWELSPVEREEKIAFTSADPVLYKDDDLFGYMRASKKKKVKKGEKSEGGDTEALTRVSPLKCSPLISVAPTQITSDFGVMSRQDGDPVPHEHQFYSCVMKGIFSISVDEVGKFLFQQRAGYKNLSKKTAEEFKNREGITFSEEEKWLQLPPEERKRRIEDVLMALPYLSGGAKHALHLTDVTPKLLILAGIQGGNHLFMNITTHKNGQPGLHIEALQEVLEDYQDRLLTNVYIGHRKGFMDELAEKWGTLSLSAEGKSIVLGTPKTVIGSFIENELGNLMNDHAGS